MTAVAQSYPNYLGGLNEQPDEVKKPGQLVEALNVIPDPTIGLTRRPGFKHITWKDRDGDPLDDMNVTGDGSWFEVERSNLINDDTMYFGCVNLDGHINIFDQDGEQQKVLYAAKALPTGKRYKYNGTKTIGELYLIDENGDTINPDDPIKCETPTDVDVDPTVFEYFKHDKEEPLKYCVSGDHIIFTDPGEVPVFGVYDKPSSNDENRYYSFINLKQIDTENYTYVFKRFYPEEIDGYNYIKTLDVEYINGIGDYRDDEGDNLQLPLQTKGPFTIELEPNASDPDPEPAVVEMEFRGQIVQRQLNSGEYVNEARYTWNTRLITKGKGFKKGTIVYDLKPPGEDETLNIHFEITETGKIRGIKYDTIVPDDISNNNSAEEILLELAGKFEDAGINKAFVTGSGLYLENNIPFSVSTAEIAVADVLNSQKMDDDVVPIVRVNSVADLPIQCYNGFIVEVVNSFDNKNNYYLQFVAESTALDKDDAPSLDIAITKSDGYWEEIAKPFEPTLPSSSKMPHMVTVVRETDRDQFVFIVSPIEWKERTAGTSLDNPSFFQDNSTITALNFYKNRLFMLTRNGTIVTSKAGDISDLFLKTAIDVSPDDPIDIVANTNQRVPLRSSIVVNNAMVIFGETEQYSLNTNGDVLSSNTVNVTKVANYTCSAPSSPVYLGTNIGFISSGLTRLYEMTNVYDRGPVDINERSQQVMTRFGRGFNMPVSSREQSMIIAYKRYADSPSGDMMMYRFRQENSQESSQTSWVQWSFDKKDIAYVSLPTNKMFVVVVDEDKECHLWMQDSSSIDGLPANSVSVVPKFTDGYTDTTDGDEFETKIVFPTIYPRGKDSNDITANVTIHRVKLSTAAVGAYNLKVERYGYDTHETLVEQTPSDTYKSNFPQLRGEHIETVPIYTRNKNLTLTLHTKFDAPLTLRSMTWEGDYNQPYYKRG